MANAGRTNGCSFRDHRGDAWLTDDVVFGNVLEGFDVVKKVESTPTGRGDRPKKDVVIVAPVSYDENSCKYNSCETTLCMMFLLSLYLTLRRSLMITIVVIV